MRVWLIRFLVRIKERLVASEIKKQEKALERASEAIDEQDELAVHRCEFAKALQAQLEERAYEKWDKGCERANAAKKKAGDKLDELKKL